MWKVAIKTCTKYSFVSSVYQGKFISSEERMYGVRTSYPRDVEAFVQSFLSLCFPGKEKWTNKYDTYCYLKYNYDLFLYNREVVFGVTLSFTSNDRFRFTVLRQDVVFLPVAWFPWHTRQKQSCGVLGNVTDGVNGQFIDWEIDFGKIQILQKFSLQVSSWFPFSIEK